MVARLPHNGFPSGLRVPDRRSQIAQIARGASARPIRGKCERPLIELVSAVALAPLLVPGGGPPAWPRRRPASVAGLHRVSACAANDVAVGVVRVHPSVEREPAVLHQDVAPGASVPVPRVAAAAAVVGDAVACETPVPPMDVSVRDVDAPSVRGRIRVVERHVFQPGTRPHCPQTWRSSVRWYCRAIVTHCRMPSGSARS